MNLSNNKNPKGLGGWLILATISLIASIILYSFYAIIVLLKSREPIYLITFFIYIILVSLAIFSLYLEFKKKKKFPKWVVITLWANMGATIIFSIMDKKYPNAFSIIILLIWTAYFSISKRVKNTFVK